MIWLAVALGGAIGAMLRYAVSQGAHLWLRDAAAVGTWSASAATLTVNALGSLCIGALLAWTQRHGISSPLPMAFLSVGLLGGFTTFSAFSREALEMMFAGRIGLAFAYAFVSVALSLGLAGLGYALVR